MHLQTKHLIGGVEIKVGTRLLQHHSLLQRAIVIAAVCDSVQPMRWHGEVALFGQCILRTESVASDALAARAAEDAFAAKALALFAA
ncbi:hypothetical protein [Nocardioides sp. W7]|uniref:hypothetical protein n=1 Tax=Nocardioides sp. W7 TaxID=2931390 RepID=UPI001FD12E57|nr:hypothetical protein [Nocardioides sp. W7]